MPRRCHHVGIIKVSGAGRKPPNLIGCQCWTLLCRKNPPEILGTSQASALRIGVQRRYNFVGHVPHQDIGHDGDDIIPWQPSHAETTAFELSARQL
jgi:hypothetical protein